jgi:hypothetical protein
VNQIEVPEKEKKKTGHFPNEFFWQISPMCPCIIFGNLEQERIGVYTIETILILNPKPLLKKHYLWLGGLVLASSVS